MPHVTRSRAASSLRVTHRPIADGDEWRDLASEIARMRDATAQVRAIDALGEHRLKSSTGRDLIDVLIDRLEAAS